MEARAGEVTKLLKAWTHGEEKALESLLLLVYQEFSESGAYQGNAIDAADRSGETSSCLRGEDRR